jgi:hypothetical protein
MKLEAAAPRSRPVNLESVVADARSKRSDVEDLILCGGSPHSLQAMGFADIIII